MTPAMDRTASRAVRKGAGQTVRRRGSLELRALLGVLIFLTLSTPSGASIRQFEVPTPNSYPESVTVGPDGHIWFTEKQGNKVGRLSPEGQISEFPIPTADSRPQGIAVGPDGNLWFAQARGNKIGRVTPAGEMTEFPVATPESNPFGITVGPDGALWFTMSGANRIGRITASGEMREFTLAKTQTPYGIAAGPDGNLWFTGFNSNTIGRITPQGEVTEFAIPTPDTAPLSIALGSDHALWFTQATGDSVAPHHDGRTDHRACPANHRRAALRDRCGPGQSTLVHAPYRPGYRTNQPRRAGDRSLTREHSNPKRDRERT